VLLLLLEIHWCNTGNALAVAVALVAAALVAVAVEFPMVVVVRQSLDWWRSQSTWVHSLDEMMDMA
jgi:hypothetical protein